MSLNKVKIEMSIELDMIPRHSYLTKKTIEDSIKALFMAHFKHELQHSDSQYHLSEMEAPRVIFHSIQRNGKKL